MDRAEIIARARRQQPMGELERKARKAGRASEEAKDLSFAQSHAWDMAFRARSFAESGPPTHRCPLCWMLGSDWDEESETYRIPIKHSPTCTFADEPPQVYAGTTYTGATSGPVGVLP